MNEILFLVSIPLLGLGSIWIYSKWRKARRRREAKDRRFKRILDEIKERHKEEEKIWGGG